MVGNQWLKKKTIIPPKSHENIKSHVYVFLTSAIGCRKIGCRKTYHSYITHFTLGQTPYSDIARGLERAHESSLDVSAIL